MDDVPDPPAHARLIKLAREAAGLSPAAAAARTGGKIGKAQWLNIERGWGWTRGERKPAPAPDATLARMAVAVGGITPDRLATEGNRPEAAEVLAEILRRERPLLDPDATEDEVRAFVRDQVRDPNHREVMEYMLLETDIEGKPKPWEERRPMIFGWLTGHMPGGAALVAASRPNASGHTA